MQLGIRSWLITTTVLAICSYGIHKATHLDCGKQKLDAWLIVWHSIIITFRLIFIIIMMGHDQARDPNLFVAILFTLSVLLGIFASIWTFIGTGWVIRNVIEGNSCLERFNLWTTVIIIATVYLIYIFFLIVFIYFLIIDSKASALKKIFFAEINRIYVDEQHATTVNIKHFLDKYKEIMAAEPMMDIEKYILLQYCSERVKETDEKTECGVCLIEFEPMDIKTCTNCKHAFHYECIIGWYKLKSYCPYCKQSFRAALLMAYINSVNLKVQMDDFKDV